MGASQSRRRRTKKASSLQQQQKGASRVRPEQQQAQDEECELSVRTRSHFNESETADEDALCPRTRSSVECWVWFKDAPVRRPKESAGWFFLAGDGWAEMGPEQNALLETAFASTTARLCALPKGHNIATAKAAVDLDRMLVLNAKLPAFAATATALPDALPVARRSRPDTALHWRRTTPDVESFDASDSELLTLCLNAGRSCVVLYSSPRAVVVDVLTQRWADCLWLHGFDRGSRVFHGRVSRDTDIAQALVHRSPDDDPDDDDGGVEKQQRASSSSSRPPPSNENDDDDDRGDDDDEAEEEEGGIPTAPSGDRRQFQGQVESLVAMGFKWKDAQWALSKAATLEEAAALLIDNPRRPDEPAAVASTAADPPRGASRNL